MTYRPGVGGLTRHGREWISVEELRSDEEAPSHG